MNTPTAAIPEGYKRDARGALIPVENIRDIDLLRDDLVLDLVKRVREQHEGLVRLKAGLFADIQAFIDLSAERFHVQVGGQKGNVCLMSFDGRFKVLRAVSENVVFDERLQVAKKLIDQCLRRWTDGARSELRALIDQAFQVDKAGQISTSRVLGLRRLEIADEEWQQAMQAIGEALNVVGSKSYVRVYERVGDSDQYRPLSLDIAAV